MSEQDIKQFTNDFNRLVLLYNWIQTGKVNQEQFVELLELHQQENQRQIDLDSFD